MYKSKAFLDDDKKMEALLRDFEDKLSLIPNIGKRATDAVIMLSMIRAYIKKQYTDIPVNTILFGVGGLIYVVNPIDLVPDNIPGIGLLDDAKVMDIILEVIHKDLIKYRKWQKENGIR